MDLLEVLVPILCFAASLYIMGALRPNSDRRKSAKPYPPGPKPLPIIGNILALGHKPHESLANLSKIYGPLMRLKLGTKTSIIVSSPEVAKLVLHTHDQVFSGRTIPEAAKALDHHKFSVLWTAPPAQQWRKLRKLCREKMLSVQKLDASQSLRREKLQNLFDYLSECSINSQAVYIGRAAFTTSLNLMSTTMFSKDFAAFGSDSSQEIRDIVTEVMTIGGKPNIADFYPIFRKVDPQGIARKTAFCLTKLNGLFEEIFRERIESRGADGKSYQPKNDLLEDLLDVNLKSDSDLSFDDIMKLLLDLLIAGIDTTSVTVEWALAELIRNPEKLLKARNELRNVVGQNIQIQESDISRLPYLQAVVKETLRFHPVLPLALPHKANEDIEINGYLIPKDAQILINVFAIARDSSIWSNSDLFIPERFLDQEIDFRGHHFELIPFGGGRRICLGLPLAYRMVHLMIATFIHNFDWKLEQGLKCEELDMNEKFGVTLQKATPLKAVPVKV